MATSAGHPPCTLPALLIACGVTPSHDVPELVGSKEVAGKGLVGSSSDEPLPVQLGGNGNLEQPLVAIAEDCFNPIPQLCLIGLLSEDIGHHAVHSLPHHLFHHTAYSLLCDCSGILHHALHLMRRRRKQMLLELAEFVYHGRYHELRPQWWLLKRALGGWRGGDVLRQGLGWGGRHGHGHFAGVSWQPVIARMSP